MREVLCRQKWAAVADARHLLSVAADRLFRRHRQRARDRLAYGGLAGAAAVCGHRARRGYAGPFDDFAHATADRGGDASGSVRLGAEPASGSWAAAGPADWHRCDDAGGQRGDAFDCAAGDGGELRGVLAGSGEGLGAEDADAGAVGAAGPKTQEADVERRMEEPPRMEMHGLRR